MGNLVAHQTAPEMENARRVFASAILAMVRLTVGSSTVQRTAHHLQVHASTTSVCVCLVSMVSLAVTRCATLAALAAASATMVFVFANKAFLAPDARPAHVLTTAAVTVFAVRELAFAWLALVALSPRIAPSAVVLRTVLARARVTMASVNVMPILAVLTALASRAPSLAVTMAFAMTAHVNVHMVLLVQHAIFYLVRTP